MGDWNTRNIRYGRSHRNGSASGGRECACVPWLGPGGWWRFCASPSGMNVKEVVESCRVSYGYGSNTVSYIALILSDQADR